VSFRSVFCLSFSFSSFFFLPSRSFLRFILSSILKRSQNEPEIPPQKQVCPPAQGGDSFGTRGSSDGSRLGCDEGEGVARGRREAGRVGAAGAAGAGERVAGAGRGGGEGRGLSEVEKVCKKKEKRKKSFRFSRFFSSFSLLFEMEQTEQKLSLSCSLTRSLSVFCLSVSLQLKSSKTGKTQGGVALSHEEEKKRKKTRGKRRDLSLSRSFLFFLAPSFPL